MNTTALLLVLFAPSADSQAVAGLFDVLDSNGDGKVVAAEISAAQQPYFQRALRVSDRNEDGALSREELTTALTDPKAVEVTASGRGDFDLTALDRNKDGYLSKDEIPVFLQERLKPLFQQSGDRISLEALQRMRGGQPPARATDSKRDTMAKSDKMTMKEDAARTADSDNRLDGFFERLDQNGDGKLTDSEVPQRMRQIAKQVDRDNDKALSLQEFRRALELQQRGKQK